MQLDNISFTAPSWILNGYSILSVLQLISNIFSMYLIIFKSSKIDNFRFYLLFFQICLSLCEHFVASFYKPIVLLPIWAIYSEGFATSYFKFSHHFCVGICVFLVSELHCALTICFLRKHYTISKIDSLSSKNPEAFYMTLCISSQILTVVCTVLSATIRVEKDQALDIISQKYPEYLNGFLSLESFELCIPSLTLYILGFLMTIALTIVFSTCAYVTKDMLNILKKSTLKISKTNITRHRSAIKGLMAQMMVSIGCISQFGIMLIVALFQVPNSQTIFHILVIVLGLHSSMNFVVLITTYQPYRQFVKSIFIWKKSSVTAMRSSIS